MYKLFLTLRYLRKRRIAYFAIGSVALCVAMVLVVHSVMSGFLDTVRNSSRRLLGDVILEIGGMETFPYYDDFIAELNQQLGSDIKAATPVIINVGLLKILGGLEKDRTHTVMVNGIRLQEYRKINSFGEGLFYEEHFPGTTSFAAQRMPTWYHDAAGVPRLPEVYEKARVHPRSTAPPPTATTAPDYPFPEQAYFSRFWEEDLLRGHTDSPEYTGEPLPGMVLGVEMVAWREADGSYTRHYPKGTRCRLIVLALTQSGDLSATTPYTTKAFRYADDSRTKIYDIDSRNVYVDFNLLQNMLWLDPRERVDGSGMTAARATQIQIKLADGVDYNAARDHIERLWQDFAARVQPRCEPRDALLMSSMLVLTWEQRNATFIQAVEKERILVLILFGIVSVVAVLLVGCIFYMIVQEKSREIGIIRSMGATARGVAGIFVVYALGIGVVGSAIGTTIGTLFVRYINEFQDFIADHIHPTLRVWSPETYSFDRIPNVVKPQDAVLIVGVAILASVVGSLAAARKAARVWPVDAIRYE